MRAGTLSAEEAARQVQSIRNEILVAQRLQSSDIGRAKAVSLKKTGLTLDELLNKYGAMGTDASFRWLFL